jgi:hypothetical protein
MATFIVEVTAVADPIGFRVEAQDEAEAKKIMSSYLRASLEKQFDLQDKNIVSEDFGGAVRAGKSILSVYEE